VSAPPAERLLEAGAAAEGKRLDLFVGEALGLSRAKLKRLFDEGAVTVGGRPAKKGQLVREGQAVRVRLEPEGPAAAPDASVELRILHEDPDLVFADKPPGVPSHPLRPGETGTVANALVARFPECAAASDDPREGGLCHRLDVETSGVIVAARSKEAWRAVRDAFGTRKVDKRYLALARGPLADEGEIDVPLRHHPRHPDRVEPALPGDEDAREASSEFKVLSRQGDLSLVEVRIHTGVLHQVRAHLAAIGAPIVGDSLYGGPAEEGLTRFFLHASRLELQHPRTGVPIRVESPLPDELKQVLERHGLGRAPIPGPPPPSR